MIVIRCPYCLEERFEDELTYGGEAGLERGADPSALSDARWSDYLYMRSNPRGVSYEQWCCSAGCGQWFKVARHTVSHELLEVLRFDEPFDESSGGAT